MSLPKANVFDIYAQVTRIGYNTFALHPLLLVSTDVLSSYVRRTQAEQPFSPSVVGALQYLEAEDSLLLVTPKVLGGYYYTPEWQPIAVSIAVWRDPPVFSHVNVFSQAQVTLEEFFAVLDAARTWNRTIALMPENRLEYSIGNALRIVGRGGMSEFSLLSLPLPPLPPDEAS